MKFTQEQIIHIKRLLEADAEALASIDNADSKNTLELVNDSIEKLTHLLNFKIQVNTEVILTTKQAENLYNIWRGDNNPPLSDLPREKQIECLRSCLETYIQDDVPEALEHKNQ